MNKDDLFDWVAHPLEKQDKYEIDRHVNQVLKESDGEMWAIGEVIARLQAARTYLAAEANLADMMSADRPSLNIKLGPKFPDEYNE